MRKVQGDGRRCEEGEEEQGGAREGVAVGVELGEGEAEGMPDHPAGDLRVGALRVFGAYEVVELGVEGALVGGEGAVATGGIGEVAPRGVQSEREPAKSSSERGGPLRGAGVGCCVAQHRARSVGGQGFERNELGLGPPRVARTVAGGDQEETGALGAHPPPVGARQFAAGAKVAGSVDVVEHDDPPPHCCQVLPHHVDEGGPAVLGVLETAFGESQFLGDAGEVVGETGGIVLPPDPEHHPPFRFGMLGGLGGEGGLAQPARPADHDEPAATAANCQPVEVGELAVTAMHLRLDSGSTVGRVSSGSPHPTPTRPSACRRLVGGRGCA